MPCFTITLVRPHPLKPEVTQYLGMRCGKLACWHCGPKKAAAYRRAVHRIAAEQGLHRMMTLTLDPVRIPSDLDSVTYANDCWHRFLALLLKHRKLKLTYIRVLQLQSNGNAHFHVLLKETLAESTVREWWLSAGGGYEISVDYFDGERGVDYVCRYLSKQYLALLPPRRRRIVTSRPLTLFPPRLPSGWKRFHVPWTFVVLFWEVLGGTVDSDDQGVCYLESEETFTAEFT